MSMKGRGRFFFAFSLSLHIMKHIFPHRSAMAWVITMLGLFVFSVQVNADPSRQPRRVSTLPKGPAPAVHAKRVIVVDYASGRVLHEKKSQERCAVASTQKLLTALLVAEQGNMAKNMVYVQKTDTRVEPSKIYIYSGEKYTRATLVKALLVKSGNDAARALARDVAGSQVKFAQMMNARAKRLGMKDSHFKNAHGLTEAGQYSTARDIAILARAAYSNATLRSYMAVKGYYFDPPGKRKKRWFDNSNKLLKRLKYCNGMKTGTTRASGKCLVSSGTLNGRTVIVVCLGSDSKHIWDDSEKLMKWALERPAAVVPKAIPVPE